MSGRVAGKVALVTGAARGQGRGYAVRLAEEGALIVGLDICAPVDTVPVPQASEDDLAETVRLVEKAGSRMVSGIADVRDQAAVDAVVMAGLAEFGRIDIAVANAGTCSFGTTWELSDAEWRTMIDVNLTGAFHTAKSVIPHMIAAGNGGSIVFIASLAGERPMPGVGHYVAAKHGVVGLMKNLAVELGPHGIRSNALLPGNVATPLFDSLMSIVYKPILAPGGEPDWQEKAEAVLSGLNPLGLPYATTDDLSNALMWLASEEARCVTGQAIPIDAGWGVWLK